jgi:hypothetical protein
MKTLAPTLTISIAFYGMLLLLLSTISFGFDMMAHETITPEADTNEIVFEFEEEAYIDDIPFDTKTIAEEYLKGEN